MLKDFWKSLKNLRPTRNKQDINDDEIETSDEKNILDEKEKKEDLKNGNIKQDTINNKEKKIPISTVSRNIKIAIAAGVFLGAAVVTYFANSSDENTKRASEVQTASKTDNTMLDSKISGDNYDNIKLSNYNDEKVKKLHPNDPNAPAKITQSENIQAEAAQEKQFSGSNNNNTNNNYSRPLPVLNSAQMPYNPYMASVYAGTQGTRPIQRSSQLQESQVTKDDKKIDNNKDILSSAIAFLNDVSSEKNTQESASSSSNNIEEENRSIYSMQAVPAVENGIQAGTIIPAILLSGINSQTGGQVMAQITANIYDSMYGTTVLIPAGSRLSGTCAGGSKQGQNRVDVKWSTLIFPDGTSFNIDGVFQTTDGSGYPGIAAKVNSHTASKLSAGMFSSALAALGSIATGNNNYTSTDNGWHDSGQLAMQGASANLLNTASELFKDKMNMEDELTVEAGSTFSLFVTQNISF